MCKMLPTSGINMVSSYLAVKRSMSAMAYMVVYVAVILLATIDVAYCKGHAGVLRTLLSRRYVIEQPTFTRCPNGFVRHDDSCYIASHDLADWPTALQYCEAYGAHLAFVESSREQNFLQGYVKNILAASTDPAHYYWLGGTDAVSEGEWIWSLVVEPITYSNWAAGEPNNNDKHSSKHQDCLGMYASSGKWDDGWCETQHNFVCEIELDVEPSNIIG